MKYKSHAVIGALALAVVLASCVRQTSGSGRESEVTVRVATARRAEGVGGVRYVGRVEPARSSLVSATHGGTLRRIAVRSGQTVRKGDVIAEVESATVQASLDMASATLAQARDGYERARRVAESGAVTEQKMVEIRTQLERAEAAERAARNAVEECTVRAPYAGVIGEVMAEEGTHTEPLGAIARLMDISSVEVCFDVPEGELRGLSVGDTAVVEVPATGLTTRGVVTRRGMVAAPLSHTYECAVGCLEEADDVLPGMVCKVALKAAGAEGLLVPASAVRTDMEGRYVWALDEGDRVWKRYVVVEGFAGTCVVVREGLDEGQRVVTDGARKVSTGMHVEVL